MTLRGTIPREDLLKLRSESQVHFSKEARPSGALLGQIETVWDQFEREGTYGKPVKLYSRRLISARRRLSHRHDDSPKTLRRNTSGVEVLRRRLRRPEDGPPAPFR